MPLNRLSVLDQSPVSDGMTARDALQNTIDLARHADKLLFTRYWLAEHHGTVMLAGTSPEILIGPVAAATTRLRVGSGGVMLPHYSPLKVSETFGMLAALHPGRIDLAVGRAAGTDPRTAHALQRDRRHVAPDDFPEQLSELLGYIRTDPTPWLLGSSPQSGRWAAEMGLPYAFADFIAPGGAAIAQRYRTDFSPSALLKTPEVIVAAWALCAETEKEAERLASSSRMAFAHFLAGQPIRVPSIETAQVFFDRQPEILQAVVQRRRAIVGTPSTVRAQLEALAAEYGADEVMVVTITYDHEDRKRSYELLARAFGCHT